MGERSVLWRVRGIVQGVGFRYFAMRHAGELGLRGWVRNVPDGSVEVAARGEASALERFRAVLSLGPRSSSVDAIEDLPAPAALDGMTGFTVK